MRKVAPELVRAQALREMLAEYRRMTVEEVEAGGYGDLQVEIEGELWRLEQELFDARLRPWKAA